MKKQDEAEEIIVEGEMTFEHALDPDAKSFHLTINTDIGMEIVDIAEALEHYAGELRKGSVPLFEPDEEMHH